MDTIFQIVKKAEKNLTDGLPIKIGKYATHNHIEKISTIDAYLNSQHISGPTDSLGREKPFFNIVLLAAYTWFKATDLDRKNITFIPSGVKQRLKALIATLKLRKWMDVKKFGEWLNKWGWTLACYGSAVSKFVEKEGKLIPSVIDWDRMICDPVSFYSGIRAEKLYFTPAELRQQPYDQDAIEEVIEKYRTTRTTLDGQKVDVKAEYIGVYEVHGELPLFYLTDKEEDMTTYRQQMHVVFIEANPKDKRKNIEVSLYRGKEEKDPYHIAHLIEQDGRVLSIGAVESVFDPQWMINDAMKKAKDQLDLSSKMIQQTSDDTFLGRNITTDVDVGSILITKENQGLLPVNLGQSNLPHIISFLQTWQAGARDVASIHEAITGEQPPSGTPYRLQALLNTEARGLFNLMRQNKGLYLEEIMKKYVLPHFKKQLKTTEDLIALLDNEELENFDNLSLPARLESELMARLFQDHIPSGEELMMAVEEQNNIMGNTRIIKPSRDKNKTWKDYFKDFDMDAIQVEITGENRDKQAIVSNLYAIFQQMMTAPQMFSPKDIKKVFDRLLDEIGMGMIGPLQISGISQQGTIGGQPVAGKMPMAAGGVGMPELTPTI